MYRIIHGDVLDGLQQIEPASVNCCVTSPPYFGLRDYGNPNQIGLEATPEDFVQRLANVFREVWRVLRDDGTLWLNIGDSYSGSGKGPAGNLGNKHDERNLEKHHSGIVPNCCKPKDLIGIPWMLANALRNGFFQCVVCETDQTARLQLIDSRFICSACGEIQPIELDVTHRWYLRQDIIWSKPNPMPESVTDRCTKSHEYVFLLTKSAKYYFDSAAIAEPATTQAHCFRNKRSVWHVATKPYPGAHFATFPPELIEPCIRAGCPVGGLVLDPFNGTGTTIAVAIENGRNGIGCELNDKYIKLATERIERSIAKRGLFVDMEREPNE